MKDLNSIREQIDKTDELLFDLLTCRFGLSKDVAQEKIKSFSPVYRKERESEILKKALESGNFGQYIAPIMAEIMRESRILQYGELLPFDKEFKLNETLNSQKVPRLPSGNACFCGSEGAYSQMAASVLLPDCKNFGTDSFENVCKAVYDGNADYGVLPIDNTTAGTVDEVYDCLIKYNLFIVKAATIPISHCLLGVKGTSISEIKTVCSHPQALNQCSEYLNTLDIQKEQFANTAFAAEYVSKKNDKSTAAIASKFAAQIYDLEILNDKISKNVNTTRFIVLAKEPVICSKANIISIIFSLPHESGSLSSVLSVFNALGLNLLKIQSRPDKNKPWEYFFYLDFSVPEDNPENALVALYLLEKELPFCKFLGIYSEN